MTAVTGDRPRTDVGARAPSGVALVRLLALGLVAGVAWGVVARLWMRFVTDTPSFTWSGTLFILGLAALAGVALGTVEALRRRGARVWRVLVAVPALVMLAGPGVLFAPAALLGGLAVSGRGGRYVRAPAAVLAAAPVAAFWVPSLNEGGGGNVFVAAAWFLALSAVLAAGWSAVWRRRAKVDVNTP